MSDLTSPSLTLELNDYRGLSAYEIAVANGFEGTEKEWLESLQGAPGLDGDTVTVNNKRAVDGNITVNATDIKMMAGSENSENVYDAVSDNKAAISEHDEQIAQLEGRTESLNAITGGKATAKAVRITLEASSWTASGNGYAQTVSVTGVTADETRIQVIASPTTASREAYGDAEIWLDSQAADSVGFAASDIPASDITVNLLIIDSGVSA